MTNVNAVTRSQLIHDYGLDASVADALVRARDELGGVFRNWTQLRAEAGIDEDVVEKLRSRGLTFGPTAPPDPPLDVPGVPAPVRDPEPEGLPGTERPGIVDRGRGGVTAPGVGGNLPNGE